MNINDNLNNQINPNRQAGRSQDTRDGRVRAGIRTGQTESPEQTGQPLITGSQQSEQAQDTVSISGETRLVNELTRAVEQLEEEPREDLIARARERIASGEYNSPSFIRRIAESLIDTTLPND